MFQTATFFVKLLFSKKRKFYKDLKKILGFYPRKIKLYETAFIHKSASVIYKGGATLNNERLEYLGDAILDAVVGDYLYHKFPLEHEGFLTQMRSKIVKGESLTELAQKTGLSKFIVANISTLKNQKHILADAFEAFIGALYLDKGYKVTKKFIIRRIIRKYLDIEKLKDIDTNYKSQLIEWAQKNKHEIVFETDVSEKDNKCFVSYVRINDERKGSGFGSSKKQAEQKAARVTLKQVGEPI